MLKKFAYRILPSFGISGYITAANKESAISTIMSINSCTRGDLEIWLVENWI